MEKFTRRRWVRWFRASGIPLPHVAAVLGCDVATVKDDARVAGRYRVANPACPFGRSDPPHRNNTRARTIRGATASRIRILAGLGYSGGRVAGLLGLELGDVVDFLSRSRRLRGGKGLLEKPREPKEAAAGAKEAAARLSRLNKIRCQRYRDRKRASWGSGDAQAEAAELRAVPFLAAAYRSLEKLVAAQAVVEIPAFEPNRWVGPIGREARGSQNGRAKLTEDDVREVRRLRAEGWSGPALARKFSVTRNAIYRALAGDTWNHV